MHQISAFLGKHKYLILLVLVVALSAVAFAQEDPAVTIDIPVEDTISYLNQWLVVFGPIFLFIGMIPVAIALLRYVTSLFKSAFGGS